MGEKLSEDMKIMLQTVRRFVERDLELVSRQVEEEDRIPPEIVEKMRDLGFFGLSIRSNTADSRSSGS